MFLLKKIALLTFIFVLVAQGRSQNADCDNLLVLEDTIYQATNVSGVGSRLEFSGNHLEDKYVFQEEKNSIWYLIKIPADGIFTFDIVADNPYEDWDFMLYRYKNLFCKRIDSNRISPLRTNLSRSPETGLSLSATENYMGAGVNEAYSKYLNVKKGDEYVLVVNNPKRGGGNHTLLLHYPQEKIEAPEVVVEKNNNTFFSLAIKDKLTRKPVLSNLKITGIDKDVVTLKDVAVFEKEFPKKNRDVQIIIAAKGYMLSSVVVDVSRTKSKVSKDILLEPIVKGAKVNLKMIQFYGNKFELLPSALPGLEALMSFMELNATVKIEIEGHVNGPGKKNSKSYKELSYSRAYAVKDYLISKGIDKDRIDFTGYGNSKMLYPKAKSAYQQAANRRVEIKILSP